MSLQLPSVLVPTEWLASRISDPQLRVVDGSWYLPQMNRDARGEYLTSHIPGAVFWDLDRLSDTESPLPHMLAAPDRAGPLIGALGVGNEHTVVVYDGSGTNLSAPRVWWTLKAYGHDRVAVLDGGLGKWLREGRAVQSGDQRPPSARFEARGRANLCYSLAQVRALVGTDQRTLVDARPAGRFEGRDPEPRPGLAGGHIPGARNVPFATLVASDGTLLSGEELRRRFADAGVDLAKPIVASCGSGVSACAVLLGLEVIGHQEHALYDGSWAEWGGLPDPPIATGPA